jgi:hypothetical protein
LTKKAYFAIHSLRTELMWVDLLKAGRVFFQPVLKPENLSIRTSAGAVCFDLKLKQGMTVPTKTFLETTPWK